MCEGAHRKKEGGRPAASEGSTASPRRRGAPTFAEADDELRSFAASKARARTQTPHAAPTTTTTTTPDDPEMEPRPQPRPRPEAEPKIPSLADRMRMFRESSAKDAQKKRRSAASAEIREMRAASGGTLNDRKADYVAARDAARIKDREEIKLSLGDRLKMFRENAANDAQKARRSKLASELAEMLGEGSGGGSLRDRMTEFAAARDADRDRAYGARIAGIPSAKERRAALLTLLSAEKERKDGTEAAETAGDASALRRRMADYLKAKDESSGGVRKSVDTSGAPSAKERVEAFLSVVAEPEGRGEEEPIGPAPEGGGAPVEPTVETKPTIELPGAPSNKDRLDALFSPKDERSPRKRLDLPDGPSAQERMDAFVSAREEKSVPKQVEVPDGPSAEERMEALLAPKDEQGPCKEVDVPDGPSAKERAEASLPSADESGDEEDAEAIVPDAPEPEANDARPSFEEAQDADAPSEEAASGDEVRDAAERNDAASGRRSSEDALAAMFSLVPELLDLLAAEDDAVAEEPVGAGEPATEEPADATESAPKPLRSTRDRIEDGAIPELDRSSASDTSGDEAEEAEEMDAEFLALLSPDCKEKIATAPPNEGGADAPSAIARRPSTCRRRSTVDSYDAPSVEGRSGELMAPEARRGSAASIEMPHASTKDRAAEYLSSRGKRRSKKSSVAPEAASGRMAELLALMSADDDDSEEAEPKREATRGGTKKKMGSPTFRKAKSHGSEAIPPLIPSRPSKADLDEQRAREQEWLDTKEEELRQLYLQQRREMEEAAKRELEQERLERARAREERKRLNLEAEKSRRLFARKNSMEKILAEKARVDAMLKRASPKV
ncbi:hypothetical protein ACHAWF_004590 [Thalassiosira exigua]